MGESGVAAKMTTAGAILIESTGLRSCTQSDSSLGSSEIRGERRLQTEPQVYERWSLAALDLIPLKCYISNWYRLAQTAKSVQLLDQEDRLRLVSPIAKKAYLSRIGTQGDWVPTNMC
jgi:hypothetical protein